MTSRCRLDNDTMNKMGESPHSYWKELFLICALITHIFLYTDHLLTCLLLLVDWELLSGKKCFIYHWFPSTAGKIYLRNSINNKLLFGFQLFVLLNMWHFDSVIVYCVDYCVFWECWEVDWEKWLWLFYFKKNSEYCQGKKNMWYTKEHISQSRFILFLKGNHETGFQAKIMQAITSENLTV